MDKKDAIAFVDELTTSLETPNSLIDALNRIGRVIDKKDSTLIEIAYLFTEIGITERFRTKKEAKKLVYKYIWIVADNKRIASIDVLKRFGDIWNSGDYTPEAKQILFDFAQTKPFVCHRCGKKFSPFHVWTEMDYTYVKSSSTTLSETLILHRPVAVSRIEEYEGKEQIFCHRCTHLRTFWSYRLVRAITYIAIGLVLSCLLGLLSLL